MIRIILPFFFCTGLIACADPPADVKAELATEPETNRAETPSRNASDPYSRVAEFPEAFRGCWELHDSAFNDNPEEPGARRGATTSRLTITATHLRQDASWMVEPWIAELDYGEMYSAHDIQLTFVGYGMVHGAGDIVSLSLGPNEYGLAEGLLDAGGDAAETVGPYQRCDEQVQE